MLGVSDLDIKFHESWQEDHRSHFLSQLLLFEVTRKKVVVQYDGGGFSDRHHTMISVVEKLFELGLLRTSKKFYIFTGDNRPGGIDFDHVYFSISGKRNDHELIVPDPYNFSWKYIGANSYDEFRKEIFENSQKDTLKVIKKAYWRGSTGEHFSREELVKKAEGNSLLNCVKATSSDNNFESLSQCGKYSALIDLPGRGWSARLKYLISSLRPVVVYPRHEWDWASMRLEPGIHYVLSLPSIDDLIQKCEMIIENSHAQNFYINSSLQIINQISEANAILSFASIINKQAD